MNGNYKGTEYYTLTKTENGWHGDPDGYSWQWLDFPDLTFTDDGDCRFFLEAESIDMAVELDEYREFLAGELVYACLRLFACRVNAHDAYKSCGV